MIEILLIILIVLAVANIFIGFRKKISIDIKPQLKEVETSIRDELQRNRTEINQISKSNRKQ